jgi:hypothetical protein
VPVEPPIVAIHTIINATTGFLKGISNSTIQSQAFGFTYQETPSAEVLEILQILGRVCTQEQLSAVQNFGATARITIQGQPATTAELRTIVDGIAKGATEIREVNTR